MLREMKVPCWEIECDLCGRGDNVEYDGCFHHASRVQAISVAEDQGFTVDHGDGLAVCDDCAYDKLDLRGERDHAATLAAARTFRADSAARTGSNDE